MYQNEVIEKMKKNSLVGGWGVGVVGGSMNHELSHNLEDITVA